MHSINTQAFYRYSLLPFLIISILLLSGCGFHLKHNNGLADKVPEIYIKTNEPKSDLVRQVKLRLRGANIKILTASRPDAAILELQPERRSERTISLYANALNAEKEIGYTLNYSIKMPSYIAKEFHVNLYRDFLDNSSEALAKSREAELLTTELRAIAADHIITTMLSMNNEDGK